MGVEASVEPKQGALEVTAAAAQDIGAAAVAETNAPAVEAQNDEGRLVINGVTIRRQVMHGRICHEIDGSWRLGPSIDKP